MPIIHMLTNEPAEDYNFLNWDASVSKYAGLRRPWPEGSYCPLIDSQDLVLYETHHGLCLQTIERNYYDDSDFLMRVWNPEKGEPEDLLYATTRMWTYPAQASRADATPEVLDAYERWSKGQEKLAEQKRKTKRATDKLALRALEMKVAKKLKVPRKRCIPLRKTFGHTYLEKLYKLILSNRISNRYKLSLQKQAVEWFQNDNPRYDTPLSARQKVYL